MAKNNNLTDFLTDVANAIRTKKGTTGTIDPQNFSSEIASISTGVDTSDGNIEPTTVLKGYKGYAKGVAVNGAIETYDGTVEDVVIYYTIGWPWNDDVYVNDVKVSTGSGGTYSKIKAGDTIHVTSRDGYILTSFPGSPTPFVNGTYTFSAQNIDVSAVYDTRRSTATDVTFILT